MCTDFLIFLPKGDAQPNDIAVSARSLEFFTDTKPQIEFTAKDTIFTSTGGEQWKVIHSYIDINAADQVDAAGNVIEFTNDGQNLAGLSVGGLWLGLSEYVVVDDPKHPPVNGVHFSAVADYLLGLYDQVKAIVDDVRAGKLVAWVGKLEKEQIEAAGGFVPPIHYAIHDRTGASAVIEFIKGKTLIYENKLHVLTNDPEFHWHHSNIPYYATLSSTTPGFTFPEEAAAIAVPGANLRGVPGDQDSASRFVRTFYFVKFATDNYRRVEYADPAGNPILFDVPNLAAHLLNAVDIPLGITEQLPAEYTPYNPKKGRRIPYNPKKLSEPTTWLHTRWALVKDLINNKFYYRTYLGYGFKVIDLNKVDWLDPAVTSYLYEMEAAKPTDAYPLNKVGRKDGKPIAAEQQSVSQQQSKS